MIKSMLISHPVDDPNRYIVSKSAIYLNYVPGSINFKEKKFPLIHLQNFFLIHDICAVSKREDKPRKRFLRRIKKLSLIRPDIRNLADESYSISLLSLPLIY